MTFQLAATLLLALGILLLWTGDIDQVLHTEVTDEGAPVDQFGFLVTPTGFVLMAVAVLALLALM